MKKILGLVLAIMMLVPVLPAMTVAETTEEMVTDTAREAEGQIGTIVNCQTRVNVREKPSHDSKLIGKANKGETFKVLGKSRNWVRVDFNGTDGYIYKTYIRIEGKPVEENFDGKVATIVNCKNAVNVREKASASSKLLGTVKRGTQHKILAKSGDWYKIQYTSSRVGYVHESFIKVGEGSGEGGGTTPPSGGESTLAEGSIATIVNCQHSVNVREKASSKSNLVGKAKKGASFKAIAVEGNWVKIVFDADGTSVNAYVFKSYVKLSGAEETIEGKTGTIKCNTRVNIRAQANADSKILGKAKNGEKYNVLGKSGNWIKIDYKGQTAYVYKTLIKIS